MASRVPAPPMDLAHRVGATRHLDRPMERYETRGRAARDQIVSMLPADWGFEGKRVLDFGCGAGRTLRHFLAEAEVAEFWGCDIDEPSIAWVNENLSPPVHALRTGETPPIGRPDGSFDLIYAVSVFTHLADSWSRWLLELHRLLRDDGVLIATYAGRLLLERTGEEWDADRIGMNVLRTWQSWDEGGPFILHSDWWIRAHWGRAFEIIEIVPESGIDSPLGPQSWALMRKRAGTFTPEELEAPEPGEERELRALRHNIAQLHSEVAQQREALLPEIESLRGHTRDLEGAMQTLTSSNSWRMTQPLRSLRGKLRRRP